ncbi:MAG: CBS domain-containing protein [Rhodothermales bacterium]|nr:CBS domain-containing protein [Rhodothermales bacterium]
MTVDEILSTKGTHVVTTTPDTPAEAAARVLMEQRVGALPVVEGDEVIGVFAERDLVRAIAERGADALRLPVRQLMIAPMETCRPDSPIQEVMRRMTASRLRHLLVVDAEGLCGIVSIGDVVKHRLREAETEAGVLRDYITVTRSPVIHTDVHRDSA